MSMKKRKKSNKISLFLLIAITILGLLLSSIFITKQLNVGPLNVNYTHKKNEKLNTNITYLNSNHKELNEKINKTISKEEENFIKDSSDKKDYLNIKIKSSNIKKVFDFEITCDSKIDDKKDTKVYSVYYDSKKRKVISFNQKIHEEKIEVIKEEKEEEPPPKEEEPKEEEKKEEEKPKEETKVEEEPKIEETPPPLVNPTPNIDINPEVPKYVAFTFDDGPNAATTSKLLDGLKERNAKVSFFMLGSRAINNQELVKRAYDEGHVVGSHTYYHKNLFKLSIEDINWEVNTTNETISNITGVSPKYLRPPYGNYNQTILENIDMTFILWNVDTEDWKKRNTDLVYEYVINHVHDGDILLFHDIYETSVDGTLKAIDYLSDKGYHFVNLDELASYKGITPLTHTAYRSFK